MNRNKRLLALVGGVAAMLAATAVAFAGTVVVAPGHMNGFTAVNDTCGAATTGSISFVSGPGTPPAGTGSVRLAVGSNGDSYPTLRTGEYSGVKLSNLTALDYWTYVSAAPGSQAPYIDLYIDNDNNGTRDDILTFEPVYNGTVTMNTWQHWNALTGQWWSDAMGGPPPLFTLASYVSSHPNARIIGSEGFILAAGCGGSAWTNFVGNADKLTIGVSGNDTTYNFEQTAPSPHAQQGKVKVCHKGHTISISRNALPAHLKHGDTAGPCP
jgi:hypothetical protein